MYSSDINKHSTHVLIQSCIGTFNAHPFPHFPGSPSDESPPSTQYSPLSQRQRREEEHEAKEREQEKEKKKEKSTDETRFVRKCRGRRQ